MKFLLTALWIFLSTAIGIAQNRDSAKLKAKDSLATVVKTDSIPKPRHNPRKASIRSAIIPGWGQAYNKKYWKIPIVYTAVGIPGYLFFYNKSWYNKTQAAARMIADNDRSRVDRKLYLFFSTSNSLPSLISYRNEFRRNMDYSVLFILLFWGLNIIDATVDAHLKEFDVSENLSLKIRPTIMRGNNIAGFSCVLQFGNNHAKTLTW
jgi:hypothetical protein